MGRATDVLFGIAGMPKTTVEPAVSTRVAILVQDA